MSYNGSAPDIDRYAEELPASTFDPFRRYQDTLTRPAEASAHSLPLPTNDELLKSPAMLDAKIGAPQRAPEEEENDDQSRYFFASAIS